MHQTHQINQNFRVVEHVEKSLYTLFLNSRKNASYYHSLEYFEALNNTLDITPIFIVVTDINGKILAATIGEMANEIRWLPLSKRLIIYDKPLYTNEDDLSFLLAHLIKHKSGLFIQIRSFFPFSQTEDKTLSKWSFNRSDHLNAYISLKWKNEQEILSSFKKDKRSNIKRAVDKYNLEIIEPSIVEDTEIDTFYKILRLLYKRKRHALKSKDYFTNLIKFSNGTIRLAFVYYQEIPIATRLFSIYNGRCTAMYVSILSEYKSLGANDLLVWYVLRKAIGNNCDYFDFGGGGNPNKSYGARDYKARFGTNFDNVGRYTLSCSPIFKLVFFLYGLILKR